MVSRRAATVGILFAAVAAVAGARGAEARPCRGLICGAVEIHAELDGAYLDVSEGRYRHVGETPMRLSLPPGTHAIKVRWGRLERTQTIVVAPRSRVEVFVNLSGLPDIEVRPARVACDRGDHAACGRLGSTLASNGDRDSRWLAVEGARLMVRACHDGVAESCRAAGHYYEDGIEGRPVHEQAVTLYDKACKAGIAGGCTDLGGLHEHGLGVPVDVVYARQLYERGCRGGDLLGCRHAALLTGTPQPPIDDATRHAMEQRTCASGEPTSCATLAARASAATGVAGIVGRWRGTSLFRRACALRSGPACLRYGEALEHGLLVPHDNRAAVAAYERACFMRELRGCARAGAILRDFGTNRETESRATRLLARGCNDGGAESCTELGVMYERGVASVSNKTKARELYEKGCKGGHARGCELAAKLR